MVISCKHGTAKVWRGGCRLKYRTTRDVGETDKHTRQEVFIYTANVHILMTGCGWESGNPGGRCVSSVPEICRLDPSSLLLSLQLPVAGRE